MSTYTATLATFVNSTAGLQTYMDNITALLLAAGWVQSADTGQLDIPSVVYNATANTAYGYQIFYLDDSQHGSFPIYLKLVWTTGTSTSFSRIQFSIAHATDGAGNLTGYTPISNADPTNATTANHTTGPAYACSLDGHAFMALGCDPTASSGRVGFTLGVTREFDDATGAVLTGGNYEVLYHTSSGVRRKISVLRGTSEIIDFVATYSFVPGLLPNSQAGGTTDVSPHLTAFPTYNNSPAYLTYMQGEIAQGQTFLAQPLSGGSPRTFICTGIHRQAAGDSTSTFTHALATLWE